MTVSPVGHEPIPMLGTIDGDGAICKRCDYAPALIVRVGGAWVHEEDEDPDDMRGESTPTK